MSRISLSGDAAGTGTFTIASPNSNSNFTLTLPTESGTVLTGSTTTGFKNRLINGEMDIDQRNNGASITFNDGVFPVDRWTTVATQSSKGTIQQNAGAVTPPAGFTNYLGFTSSSAYSVLTGDAFAIQQRIEGLNVSDLAWGTASAATVTLSFWVRSSLTGTFGGSVSNSAQNRSYPFTYTITAANTWELETVTIPGDTSGTWLTTNGIGARINLGLGAGATFSGTAGAWSGSTLFSATGAVSVVGTNGATFYATGAQFEKGTQATSFDFRDYGRELIMCQRYYEVKTPDASGYTVVSYPYNAFTAGWYYWFFKVNKRANPTITGTGYTVAHPGPEGVTFFNSGAVWVSTSILTASSEL
jgi:hypothetical protein